MMKYIIVHSNLPDNHMENRELRSKGYGIQEGDKGGKDQIWNLEIRELVYRKGTKGKKIKSGMEKYGI